MDKAGRIKEFLDYGGNELFSTLMCSGIRRSEGENRLCVLLDKYSDVCRFKKGRSCAYRYMLSIARRSGWLKRGAYDLKSYRLTREERARVEEKVCAYIKSGGALFKYMKYTAAAAIAAGLIILAGVLTYKRLKSEEYKKQFYSYYSEQVIVNYKGKNGGRLEFEIYLTENAPLFMHLSGMPTLYYGSSDAVELKILPEHDILSPEDDRADYTETPEVLALDEQAYHTVFFAGEYRAEFEFYCQTEFGNDIHLPVKTVHFTV